MDMENVQSSLRERSRYHLTNGGLQWKIRIPGTITGHDEESSRGKEEKSRFFGYRECPRITNTMILTTFISYAIMSMICLLFVIQASRASSNDMSNIRSILSVMEKNFSPPSHLSRSTTSTPVTISPKGNAKAKDEMCDNHYRNKCFRLVNWRSNMTRAEAMHECQRINGELANVYDLTHFVEIAKLIKNVIKSQWHDVNAWTGMTVDNKTRTMYLSNLRRAAADIPFFPGKQYSQKYKYLSLRVRSTTNIYARGMSDSRLTNRFDTALCEVVNAEAD